MKHIVIIGNGISGVTAARYIRKKSNHQITIISSESKHFYSRTALMYIYMGHMKYEHTKPYEDSFWEKNNIQLVFNHVKEIAFDKKQLHLMDGKSINYDVLILALGSKPNFFSWKGVTLEGIRGMYSLQDLNYIEQYTDGINEATVVGGGLIGVELAEMLHSRGIHTHFIVRENHFWSKFLSQEESEMVSRHIKNHGIDLRLACEVDEFLGDKRIQQLKLKNGEILNSQFAGICIGVSPNIEFLKNNHLIKTNRGILVDEFLQTNVADVYAVGDCVEHIHPPVNRPPVEQVWYTGKIMGETVAQTICGKPTKYAPGIWFNSAKFFDLEYQTYGLVPKNNETATYLRQDFENERSIRIEYNKSTKSVLMVSLLGIRMRHEVWDHWIRSKASIDEVLKNISLAFFDPEFTKPMI